MEKIAYKNGKRIGKVIHETTLYFIQIDSDLKENEVYAYAELENAWMAGEVRDMDDPSENITVEEVEE